MKKKNHIFSSSGKINITSAVISDLPCFAPVQKSGYRSFTDAYVGHYFAAEMREQEERETEN